MRARKVHYFSSEMGAEEFLLRVREHNDLPIDEWKSIVSIRPVLPPFIGAG